MNVPVYILSKIIVLLLGFGVLSMLHFGLRYALIKLGWTLEPRQRFLQTVLLSVISWMLILAIFALSGYSLNLSQTPPLVFWVLIPPILFFWILLFLPAFQKILIQIPKPWLFYAQSFRLVLDLIFWLGFLGAFVPKQMTFLWLNFDYSVGVTAFFAGYTFFGQRRQRKLEGILWNVFGLFLLFNQVFLGYISLPFPKQVIDSGISSIFLTDFPFVWIWGLFIPFGFALHTSSLFQILYAPQKKSSRKFSLKRKPK